MYIYIYIYIYMYMGIWVIYWYPISLSFPFDNMFHFSVFPIILLVSFKNEIINEIIIIRKRSAANKRLWLLATLPSYNVQTYQFSLYIYIYMYIYI